MDSVQITARLDPGLVSEIDKFAGEQHWSRAAAVRALIERGLQSRRRTAMAGQVAEDDSDVIGAGDGDQIIRAKWVMDGAATLAEAAEKVRAFAAYLDDLHEQGWTLQQPVDDDYGFLAPPA